MAPSARLSGRVALVTGGARGIGAEIARRFVAEGAQAVYAMDIAPGPDAGRGAPMPLRGDVRNVDDCVRCVETVITREGRLDVLVNNAGISRPGVIHGPESIENWRDVIDVNLNGAFYMTQAAVPHMIERTEPSCIINITSIAADVANPVIHPGYAASKGALISFTKHLAATHAKFGIRCCAIAPAAIQTALWDGMDEATKALYAGLHPLGVGQPADVGALAAFLASDDARWITGTVVYIDGGNLCAGGLAAYARDMVR